MATRPAAGLRSVQKVLLRRRWLALRRAWIEQPYGEKEITLLEAGGESHDSAVSGSHG